MFSWHIDRPEIEINYTQRFPHIYTALIKSFFPFFHASNNVTQQYGSFLFSRTAFSNGSLIQVTRTSSIVTLIKQRKKSYLWLIHILIIIFSSPFLFRYVSWSDPRSIYVKIISRVSCYWRTRLSRTILIHSKGETTILSNTARVFVYTPIIRLKI